MLSLSLSLALVSWLVANVVVLGAALRRGGRGLLGFWALQTGLVVAAVASTLDSGGIRIAPPLIALGVAGQLAGLVVAAASVRGGHHPLAPAR